MKKFLLFIIVVVAGFILLFSQDSESITNEQNATSTNGPGDTMSVKKNAGLVNYAAQDIRNTPSVFSFSFSMKEEWRARGMVEPEALNLYDRQATTTDESALEQSQVFITAFVANDFQTTEEVSILSRTEHEVVDRPAVSYLISSNGSDIFSTHPSWREKTHKITQIRVSDENPSLFYTFAKHPNLSDAEFQRLLRSLQL